MDLLADLFHTSGIRRRLIGAHPLLPGTALRFPCERSIGCHVVTQGQAWLHAPGLEAPQRLSAGDIAVMARGCDHLVAAAPALQGLAVHRLPLPPSEGRPEAGPGAAPGPHAAAAAEPAPGGSAALVSGAYQLWHAPVHPFFRELPPWRVLRGDQLPRLGPISLTVALLGQEAARQEPGSTLVLHGLLDVLFTYLMRELLADAQAGGAGLTQAQRDPPVRRAVELMHADCARAWTLEGLARAVGLSRTVLAERFRLAMGDTPLSYLRTVRLQRAIQLLGETDRGLEQVAADVGYQDAFGFSKAFKRAVGCSPSEFRRRDAIERQLPWRFGPESVLPALAAAAPAA